MDDVYSVKDADALIFANGERVPNTILSRFIVKKPRLVVSADNGYSYARQAGYASAYLVGDLDSIGAADLETCKAKIIRYDCDKDDTDTALALQTAYEQGAKTPALIGGGGGRNDHFLANLSLFLTKATPIFWLTKHDLIAASSRFITITGEVGAIVSFYPLTSVVEVKSEGLTWPITRFDRDSGFMSLSNRLSESVARVAIKTGRLAVMLPHQVGPNALDALLSVAVDPLHQ